MYTPATGKEIGEVLAGRDSLQSITRSLHAKALAALCATRGQHLAATLGRHTSAETVALSPLSSVRLVRALHVYSLSQLIEQPGNYSARYTRIKENS